MNGKKGIVMETSHPELLAPPHILDKLIDIVAGEWLADPFQLEELAAHLSVCSYCRTGLILLLRGEQKYEKQQNDPKSIAAKLLERVFTIHHEIVIRGYEYMGAYAEAIVAEGRGKADKRFPILAEHIKRCRVCQTFLKETLTYLKEVEEEN